MPSHHPPRSCRRHPDNQEQGILRFTYHTRPVSSILQMYDEREENFREMAALGNVKAMKAYLRGGVDIDGQNKMNGQTALHWACVRGNVDAVDLLVRAGADATVKNNKGQTPLDVCKNDSVRTLLPTYKQDKGNIGRSVATKDKESTSAGGLVEASFVPNYIVNPDLSKAWGIPEDAIMPAQGESGHIQQLQFEASMSKSRPSNYKQDAAGNNAPASSIPAHTANRNSKSEVRELLVYNNQYSEDRLLGLVHVDANSQTIDELKSQLGREMDAIPENAEFSLARYTGKRTIPVNVKQGSLCIDRVFSSPDDSVIVIRNSQQ